MRRQPFKTNRFAKTVRPSLKRDYRHLSGGRLVATSSVRPNKLVIWAMSGLGALLVLLAMIPVSPVTASFQGAKGFLSDKSDTGDYSGSAPQLVEPVLHLSNLVLSTPPVEEGVLSLESVLAKPVIVNEPRQSLPLSSLIQGVSSENPGELKSVVVKKGDTLSKIFGHVGLPMLMALELVREPQAKMLNRLSLGQEMRFYFDHDQQFDSLEYDINNLQTIVVAALPEGDFQIAQHKKEVKFDTLTASGVIDSSLSQAADKAGISMSLALSLVDIFKWEIDFARDIQPGDEFRMIYQKAHVDGEVVGDGPILAAEFINNGKSMKAVRFIDDDNIASYYSPKGDSLKRGFLRTPVELARISSGFTKRRYHPIKKTWRAHKGVDYAARKGTPILATGDATVQFAGRKSGYGKTIVLRHGSKYTTLYAHMSRYGKGLRSGKRVSQGQVIGYVGSTGLATGPHLHYEFRVYGKHKNPLKVTLPKAVSLEKKYMSRFQNESKMLLAYLGKLAPTQLATN